MNSCWRNLDCKINSVYFQWIVKNIWNLFPNRFFSKWLGCISWNPNRFPKTPSAIPKTSLSLLPHYAPWHLLPRLTPASCFMCTRKQCPGTLINYVCEYCVQYFAPVGWNWPHVVLVTLQFCEEMLLTTPISHHPGLFFFLQIQRSLYCTVRGDVHRKFYLFWLDCHLYCDGI